MKNVNSFGKELFPGAIINFVVKSTKKRYRAKVNSIKNHNYDADVYDDVEEVSPGDTVDTAMTGVIITDKVLVDLHFIKVEMKHANIYFHLNLVGDTDCIISAIKDEHGKMTFYLKNMADGVIKNKLDLAARLKRLPTLLETEIGVENIIEKIFGMSPRTEEDVKNDNIQFVKHDMKVTYVHQMQHACAKWLGGRPLQLAWKSHENGPEKWSYPENWEDQWINETGRFIVDLADCIAIKRVHEQGTVILFFGVNKRTIDGFFYYPKEWDREEDFINDLKYEIHDDYCNKYPEVFRISGNKVNIFACGRVSVKDYDLVAYRLFPHKVDGFNVPKYINTFALVIKYDGGELLDDLDWIYEFIKFVPEDSMFNDPRHDKNFFIDILK